ncbi:MAG: outer membrane beta-barrel protein [Bacteroidales bacterium]|nr:outer membrane beta-barrel protein [Bacteroidales bacterium]
MKGSFTIYAGLLVCLSSLFIVEGRSQETAIRQELYQASTRLAEKYQYLLTSVASAGVSESRFEELLIAASHDFLSSRALIFNDLDISSVTGRYITPAVYLAAFREKYSGRSDLGISLIPGGILQELTEGNNTHFQVQVSREMTFVLPESGQRLTESNPLFFWCTLDNGVSRIISISEQSCNFWPLLPKPMNMQVMHDCKNDQARVSWEFPFDICEDSLMFEIYGSYDNRDYQLLGSATGREMVIEPDREADIFLKIKTRTKNRESDFSTVFQCPVAPSPSGLTAREFVLRKQVLLIWESANEQTFNIYRGEGGRRSTPQKLIGSTHSNRFLDEDFTDGRTYIYSVTGTCLDGSETKATTVEINTVPPIKISTSVPDIRSSSILLKWKPPETQEDLLYCIYRAEKRRNRFRKIADDLSPNTTSFLDASPALGTNIYYKITITSDTTTFERDFSNIKNVPFTYSGFYAGVEFKPVRSRLRNDYFDKDPLAALGSITYASFSVNADYFFHDLIGAGAGIGMSTFSRDKTRETDFTYKLTYIDVPLMLKSPIIRPYNFKNKVILNPIVSIGARFSYLVSESHSDDFSWDGLNEMNIALIGSVGVNFFVSRSLQIAFCRAYSHGLTNVGGVVDGDTDEVFNHTISITRGFDLSVFYKIR